MLQTVELTRVSRPPERILTYARELPSEPWSTYRPPSVIETEPEISRQLDTETEPTICRSNDQDVTPVGHTCRLLKDIVTDLELFAALMAGYGSKNSSPAVLEAAYVTCWW